MKDSERRRLPLAAVATVNLDDPVLERQAGKGPLERPIAIHGHIEPALGDLGLGN